MPDFTLAEIAASLGLTAAGDGDIRIAGVAEPETCPADHLALAMKPEYAEALTRGDARAAMMWDGADWQSYGLDGAILAKRPRFALSGLSATMDPGQGYSTGIHPMSDVHPEAELAPDVTVAAFSVIGRGAKIGAGSVIGPQVHIGADTEIGPGALIHAGARIGARCTIGAHFICQPNAVIGGDGFSFVTPEPSTAEKARAALGESGEATGQPWARIHSLGGVTIGDDVEVGANSTIDRGTVRDTRIGTGTKIDSLVQIGHNCIIGEHSLLCGMVGIGGSTEIGSFVVLGGQTGVSDNIRIGDNVVCGGATVVLSSIPAGRVMLGYPATKMDSQIEIFKAMRRLPRLVRDVAELRKTVSKDRKTD
ncbi:UDP-3-O-[3-hydroxymyristoyl] glucosamine N-acyltransferase [Roseivivax halotolerans]|uniref:UDP-3-O-[3-hydroxymyristoyl] glucosamine N-acyltransferase n=1 Tax=Roseivivax halotolerans TaxID=93684 RepID=A0A1I5ZIN1_9RHOB|nr:UDP-3-O-(3-hydroxymyristoyl)glucosamine N-acyltransferase [Roseivivax halotolerans]SFQ56308.1 UDP-3-O-[3-hydroxymyristoyl] glucosamine N-acyltransferase [Roseivivax halotolerans]